MTEYHKIHTLYKRNENHQLIRGDWSQPAFDYLQNCEWEFTEKVDGTNIRVMLDEQGIRFGGRTDRAQLPTKLLHRLRTIFSETLVAGDRGVLYGEGYGAGIQKGGGNYSANQDFVLFDAKIGGYWLERDSLEDLAKSFQVDIVPVIGYGTLHEAQAIVEKGLTSTWGPFTAEGIVARPSVQMFDRFGHRIIAKIKHKDFYQ